MVHETPIWKLAAILATIFLLAVFWPVNALAVGPLQKPRVAVKAPRVGPKVSKASQSRLDKHKLLDAMERALLSVRKFDLVSRRKTVLKDVREEQQFAKSDLSAGDAAREGKLQNADYLVLPTVQTFAFYTITNKIPHLKSKYIRSDHGSLEVSVQVVDTTTGQIKSTFQLASSFSSGERTVNRAGGVPSASRFSVLAKKVSAQMVDQLLDLVFPVRILKVQGDRVYLNRGKDGGFRKGMTLKVFVEGEALVDPYTNEVLGSAEEYAGKIKVTRINPKFTLATVVDRSTGTEIVAGCIVRKP